MSLGPFVLLCVVIALAGWAGLSALTYSTVSAIARRKTGRPLTLREFLRFCTMHVAGYGVMMAGLGAGIGGLMWTAKQGQPAWRVGVGLALGAVIVGQCCLYVGNRSLRYFANQIGGSEGTR